MAVDEGKAARVPGRFVATSGPRRPPASGPRSPPGLYRALAHGPGTPAELAERTGPNPALRRGVAARPGRRWLRHLRPAERRTPLTEEQAFALADPDGPVYLPGAFLLALGALKAEPRITEAFRTGAGMGWHEHDPGRVHRLRAVLPARLPRQPGARVAPRAGRRGGQARRPARGSPTSAAGSARRRSCSRRRTRTRTFVGSDYHEESIELARKQRRRRGRGRPGELRGRLGPDASPARATTW